MNKDNSQQTLKQGIRKKRGPKPGATITRIVERRDILEKAYLELYLMNCMDVGPEAGFTALAKYIYKKVNLLKHNGKKVSVNTIRQELTEIAKENNYVNPRNKKNK